LKKLPLDIPVLYFFCRYKEQHGIHTILATLLKQLVLQRLVTGDGMGELKDAKAKHKHLSTEELTALLIKQLSLCSKAFIIFDAFDEILKERDRFQLLDILQEVLAKCAVQVMLLSRPSAIDYTKGKCLNIYANNEDICIYIQNQMQKHSTFVQKLSRLDQEKIIEEVSKKADGMYVPPLFYLFYLILTSEKKVLVSSPSHGDTCESEEKV